MRIEDLLPPGGELTSGLALEWQGCYLFAVEPARFWREKGGAPLVRYVGIGGHREPGETWAQCVAREAMEEANLRIKILDSTTLWEAEPVPRHAQMVPGGTADFLAIYLAWRETQK